ncbi:MAG TPA: adenosine deaminase [Conexibacter sp.]|nr:adenosine deaminase [Conexibacter sp.]
MNSLPKVELHLHLDCCVSYACVRALRPQVDLRAYREDYVAPEKCTNLVDFLTRPTRIVELMQTEPALRLVIEDLFDQLQRDGVIYAEIRFAPLLHVDGELSASEVVRIVESAVADASAATGVAARAILCTLRHYTAEQSMETARLAREALERGVVVALDIAGDEAGFPLDAHADAFAYARWHGVQLTAHAGESAGPESVWETLRRLEPRRIGHGVRSIEDEALLAHLIERDIHLEVCPTSNVQTMAGEVPAYADHPVDALYRRGVPLSISTDARTVCDVTLAREYERLRGVFGWTDADLSRCNAAAVRASFAPEELKARLLREIADARATVRDAAPTSR